MPFSNKHLALPSVFHLNVFGEANNKKEVFSLVLQNREFVLCCGIWKNQTTLGAFSLHSSSDSFSSQLFCVTMRIRSVLFPLNGNWNAPVTSRAIWWGPGACWRPKMWSLGWESLFSGTEDVWWIPLETAALFSHTAGIRIECCCFFCCSVAALNGSAGQLSSSERVGEPWEHLLLDNALSRLRFNDPHELCQLVLSCQFLKSHLPELSSFVVSAKQAHLLGHEEKQHFC